MDENERTKLERLLAEVNAGIAASQAGDSVEIDQNDLDTFVEKIMAGVD